MQNLHIIPANGVRVLENFLRNFWGLVFINLYFGYGDYEQGDNYAVGRRQGFRLCHGERCQVLSAHQRPGAAGPRSARRRHGCRLVVRENR